MKWQRCADALSSVSPNTPRLELVRSGPGSRTDRKRRWRKGTSHSELGVKSSVKFGGWPHHTPPHTFACIHTHRYAVAGKEVDWEQALGTSEATPGIVSIAR